MWRGQLIAYPDEDSVQVFTHERSMRTTHRASQPQSGLVHSETGSRALED
jgi:hypothetical protein